MIHTKTELLDYLNSIGYDKQDYKIAVEALIFTPDGKVLLEKRGNAVQDEAGKFEGVGGGLDNHENLHLALQEEVTTELGDAIKVTIDRILEVRQVQFMNKYGVLKDWIVVSYLCRQIGGTPEIGEPGKVESLHEFTLDEIYALDEAKISKSVVMGREVYKAKYGSLPYYEVTEDAQ